MLVLMAQLVILAQQDIIKILVLEIHAQPVMLASIQQPAQPPVLLAQAENIQLQDQAPVQVKNSFILYKLIFFKSLWSWLWNLRINKHL